MAPGPHALEVRAEGHHTFTLLVDLVAGQELFVPVALRRRAPPPTRPRTEQRAEAPPPTELPPPPPPPPLPPGVQPPRLQVVARPSLGVRVDGEPQAKSWTVAQGTGVIQVGPFAFLYAVRERGDIALTVPTTGAWTRDGAALAPGATVVIVLGVIRLEVTGPEGVQSFLFKRDR